MTDLRTIDQVLHIPGGGQFLDRANAEHRDLMQALKDHVIDQQAGADGSLTLKLAYSMDRDGIVTIKASVSVTPPKPPSAKGVAWMGEDGHLTTANPNQLTMDIRAVEDDRDLRDA